MPDRDHLPRPPVRRRRRDVPPGPPPGPATPEPQRVVIDGVERDVQLATRDSPQPAPGIPGRLIYAPDSGLLYRDTGAQWEILRGRDFLSRVDVGAAEFNGVPLGIDPAAPSGFRAFDAAVRARVGAAPVGRAEEDEIRSAVDRALTTEMRAVEQAAREQAREAYDAIRDLENRTATGGPPVPYAAAALEAAAMPTRLPEPPDRIDVTSADGPTRQYISRLPDEAASIGLDRYLYGTWMGDPGAGPWRQTATPGVWEQEIPIPADRSVPLVTDSGNTGVEIDAAITGLRIEMTVDNQLRFTLEGQALNPAIITRLQSMYNNNRRVRLVLALDPDD